MITLITGIIGMVTALTIVILIRRDHLHVRYGLGWIAAAVIFALLGLFPSIVDRIAAYLGVSYPPVLALTLGFSILVIKILTADIERSRNLTKVHRLVQRVALLETELEKLRETVEKADDNHDDKPE
jgi:hypothetical protein